MTELAMTWREPLRLDDLTVVGRYLPAGRSGESIAGDFFDVFRLGPSRVLIAVGDVSGHGAGACARMTWLRAATRAHARDLMSPAEVLAELDVQQAQHELEDIATLWLGLYDPRSGLLRYANAGHPPPVLAGIDGSTVLLAEASAPPLGTGVVGRLGAVHKVRIPIGGVLLAYSDGLVERPDRDIDAQIDGLRALVHRCLRAPASQLSLLPLVDRVLEELVPDPGAARDDVCLVALRREHA